MKMNGRLAAGLGALLMGIIGCGDPQGNYDGDSQQRRYDAADLGRDVLQGEFGLASGNPNLNMQQRNAAAFGANFISEEKRNNAIRNRNEPNNILPQPTETPQIQRPKIFEIYSWIDANGNGIYDDKTESPTAVKIGGEGATVRRNQNFLILGSYVNHVGTESELRLYDSNGKEIYKERKKIDTSPWSICCSIVAGQTQPGNYTAVFDEGRYEIEKETDVIHFSVSE